MYQFCRERRIEHRCVGKWIVAQTSMQAEELESIHSHSSKLGVPTNLLSVQETKKLEPAIRARFGALNSPTTGIVDSHGLMQALYVDIENFGGDIVVNSRVDGVKRNIGGEYEVSVCNRDSETTKISAEILINASGLSAIEISNRILPPHRHINSYFCKGSYYTLTAPLQTPPITRLIYPTPQAHGAAGLGTHLTLDLSGRLRFGPDVEWISDPLNLDVSSSSSRIEAAAKDIEEYLPGVAAQRLVPDYAGIRPKLTGPKVGSGGGGVRGTDFVISQEIEDGLTGFVNLLGIESPGLTSSLAIGEYVEELLYK